MNRIWTLSVADWAKENSTIYYWMTFEIGHHFKRRWRIDFTLGKETDIGLITIKSLTCRANSSKYFAKVPLQTCFPTSQSF